MRNASSNWLGKTIMSVVMGVLIVSFAVWGIADIFKGFGQASLAKVGDTEITTEQFRQLYTDRLQQIGRQFGRALTSEQARQFGLDRQVLQQTIAEATLDEQARRMGLGQSNAAIAHAIETDQNFAGINGKFDPQRFAEAIRQAGFTEQRYVAEQRKVTLRRQIANTVTAGLTPSKTQLEALERYQNEERTIEYVKLGAAQAGTIPEPTPEELSAYFDEHKAQFRAPEYRKIAVLSVTPEALAKTIKVSDEDAKKVFEQRRDEFAKPERREVLQIPFPTMEEATAARAKIAAGTSFEDIAKERKLTPSDIDLGLLTKTAMSEPAIANAAFTLPINEVSQPLKGALVTALIKVIKIEPGTTPSYESVAPTIKTQLAQDRARGDMSDLRNKIEDERAGGSNIAEAAKKLGLDAVTIEAVDRSGRGPDGQPVQGLPQGADVVSAAFGSDVGVENDSVHLRNGGELWFDVLGVTPSRERPLDEVKDQVVNRWKDDKISARLRAKAVNMADSLAKGGSFADEAAKDSVSVEKTSPFKRTATVNGLPDQVVQAAFATAKDAAGQTQGATGRDWVVFKVTDVTVPKPDLASDESKKLKDVLSRAMGDEQIAEYIQQLENEIGVSVNQSAFAVATGATSSQ
ncbi:peptidylprolyl isomerase [Afipia sp. Root123D2]|nr:peptidylprolyl isomerase [Afipia sp. Root123D2]